MELQFSHFRSGQRRLSSDRITHSTPFYQRFSSLYQILIEVIRLYLTSGSGNTQMNRATNKEWLRLRTQMFWVTVKTNTNPYSSYYYSSGNTNRDRTTTTTIIGWDVGGVGGAGDATGRAGGAGSSGNRTTGTGTGTGTGSNSDPAIKIRTTVVPQETNGSTDRTPYVVCWSFSKCDLLPVQNESTSFDVEWCFAMVDAGNAGNQLMVPGLIQPSIEGWIDQCCLLSVQPTQSPAKSCATAPAEIDLTRTRFWCPPECSPSDPFGGMNKRPLGLGSHKPQYPDTMTDPWSYGADQKREDRSALRSLVRLGNGSLWAYSWVERGWKEMRPLISSNDTSGGAEQQRGTWKTTTTTTSGGDGSSGGNSGGSIPHILRYPTQLKSVFRIRTTEFISIEDGDGCSQRLLVLVDTDPHAVRRKSVDENQCNEYKLSENSVAAIRVLPDLPHGAGPSIKSAVGYTNPQSGASYICVLLETNPCTLRDGVKDAKAPDVVSASEGLWVYRLPPPASSTGSIALSAAAEVSAAKRDSKEYRAHLRKHDYSNKTSHEPFYAQRPLEPGSERWKKVATLPMHSGKKNWRFLYCTVITAEGLLICFDWYGPKGQPRDNYYGGSSAHNKAADDDSSSGSSRHLYFIDISNDDVMDEALWNGSHTPTLIWKRGPKLPPSLVAAAELAGSDGFTVTPSPPL